MYYVVTFSFSINVAPNLYNNMRFPVRLSLTQVNWCDLGKWAGSPMWINPDSYNPNF